MRVDTWELWITSADRSMSHITLEKPKTLDETLTRARELLKNKKIARVTIYGPNSPGKRR